MSTATHLISATEFFHSPNSGGHTELVRGEVITMNPPGPRHGQLCSRIDRMVGGYVESQDLGHVLVNDTGIITSRNPDSVRGADVAFFSYGRLPRGPLPDEYHDVVPELVFEILSPSDRWSDVLQKVAEYLQAGVVLVCVVDPRQCKVHVYRADAETVTLSGEQNLVLPEVFGDFAIPLSDLFR